VEAAKRSDQRRAAHLLFDFVGSSLTPSAWMRSVTSNLEAVILACTQSECVALKRRERIGTTPLALQHWMRLARKPLPTNFPMRSLATRMKGA
jgi:hypothetical protein